MDNKKVVFITLVSVLLILIPKTEFFGQENDFKNKYENIDKYRDDGYAEVTLNRKKGLIDREGNEVIPCKYSSIRKSVVISPNGYKEVFFVDGLLSVSLDGKWGNIDEKGKEITPLIYDDIDLYRDDRFAKVKRNGKYGYVDKKGEEVVNCKYEILGAFEEDGLASIKNNGKWGYIDMNGIEVIPCKYDNILRKFSSDGFTLVEIDGKFGYVDVNGTEVVPCKYDKINEFKNGIAVGSANRVKMYIDRQGNEYKTKKEAQNAIKISQK